MPEEKRDRRWDNGMDGWRVRVLYGRSGAAEVAEITGYENGIFWVIPDGEDEPIQVPWDWVRPA